ncbi:phage tail tape measure protein [Streptomyces iconiensis]|uniref:Phage tail tape measure protein n=1 Tax=Streptomyces iconiensis TaxID=1384038 RepID=A0ABT7A579_9ACTN|nr:phage tail tape measure protein [Streptomyces iconiensis]MDJ1136212.1 phage tail tape measure protein [Streptomyces iconiensis]
MALTVGELTALVSVDDERMSAGLNRAEGRVRTAGREMGDEAARAGRHAGQALGDGVARGADGGLQGTRSQFARAGQQAGGEFADGAADGSAGAGEQIGGRLQGMKAGIAGGAAALGAAAGALLVAAMGQALEQSRIAGRLGAQLGATPAVAKRYGEIAGAMYANAITEDFQGAADAISATMRSGLVPTGATNAQIESISTKVSDLASTFELDLGQTANAVGQIMKTKLAPNAEAALDVMTRGMQKMGPRADDLMDTFNEYAVQFAQLGLSAKEATGMMSQGLKAGARDTDVVADALKEFVLIAQGGGDEVDKAFAAIGLSGDEMQRVFSKGGPKAKEALDKVFDGLRNIKDPSERAALSLTLFGTKSEDTQKALMALDPSSAVGALGKVGGAADKMGNTLRDNAGSRVEAFKRTMQQGFVDFLGGTVLPALEKFRESFGGAFSGIGQALADFWEEIAPHLEKLQGVFGEITAAFSGEGDGGGLGAKVQESLGMAAQIIQDVVTLIDEIWSKHGESILEVARVVWDTIGAYVSNAMQLVKGIIEVVTGLISGDWDKVWQGIKDMTGGIWGILIALVSGAISLLWAVLKLGLKFVGQIIADGWDWAVEKTKSKWRGLLSWFGGIPQWAADKVGPITKKLSDLAARAGKAFKDWLVRKFRETVDWAAGLPDRLVRAVGDLKDLLVGTGKDVARGLLRGIKSMGGWMKDKLVSFAKSAVPGPIAKALGIHSPSRVMAQKVGRWIPAGIVQGIEGGAGALDRTMRALVTPPPLPSFSPAYAGAGASPYGRASASGAPAGPTVHVEHWHAAENGSPDDNARALAWAAKARG